MKWKKELDSYKSKSKYKVCRQPTSVAFVVLFHVSVVPCCLISYHLRQLINFGLFFSSLYFADFQESHLSLSPPELDNSNV